MTETMGPIYARDHEHLGTTDSMIIRTRRRWIAAAKALRDHGVVPPGVDDPTVYRQRSGECILPRNEDWWDGSRHLREVWTAGEIGRLRRHLSAAAEPWSLRRDGRSCAGRSFCV